MSVDDAPAPAVEGPRFNEVQIFDRYIPKPKEIYNRTNLMSHVGNALPTPGRNKNGELYQRYFDYGPGGQELMYLAAGLRKDLRKIPGTQTLRGAKQWIDRTGKKNWEAIESDFTGPEFKPDGIPEVVVTDGKGRVKVVNGYALKNSDYPWRKAYYTEYDTKEKQMATPYSEFRRLGGKVKMQPDANGNYLYDLDLPLIRNEITPRTLYRQLFFAPTYRLFKDILDEIQWPAMDKARLSGNIFKACYETIIVKTAIANKAQIDPADMRLMPEKQYKKLLHKKVLQAAIKDCLNDYLRDEAGISTLLLKTAWQIVHSLEELADIDIPREDRTVYGISLDTLMSYHNVTELEAHIAPLLGPIATGYNQQIQDYEDAIATSLTNKKTERQNKINARDALHRNYTANRIAQGTSAGRRDAMYGDYYGLARLPEHAGYYRP